MSQKPIDLPAARRRRKSKEDGTCGTCGSPRVVCSPYGRRCCYVDEVVRKRRVGRATDPV